MIEPHGGKLVNRILEGEALADATARAASLPQLVVNYDTARDAQNIARGVFSPCEGFIGRDDLSRILADFRLADGTPWTIPIMLDVPAADSVPVGDVALVQEGHDGPLAIYHLSLIHISEPTRPY